jgi:hypothetical protein
LILVSVFLALFGIVVTLQWTKGALAAEFGGDSDEPAHFVTGLMTHDYLAAGMPWPPLAYAQNYYLHYPKVGMGHWPPVFYMVQALWMLVFGVSHVSVMLLMASLTAFLTTVVFEIASQEFGLAVGIATAILFLTSKAIAIGSMLVMTEILLTLLVLFATLAFARYLDEPVWRNSAWFGLWAALALLSKGSAVLLVAVPPVAVLLSGRFGLLRRFSFWWPAVFVLAVAGPWYLLIPGAQHEKVRRFGDVLFIPSRFRGSLLSWVDFVGKLLSLAMIVGLFVLGRMIYRRRASGLWMTGTALLIGAILSRFFIGAWEIRHLVVCVPVLMLLAMLGVQSLRQVLVGIPARLQTGVLAIIVVGLAAWNISQIPTKKQRGYSETAASLIADTSLKDAALLVCSNSTGEGVFISEVAMMEKRPGHRVLRGSKVLAVIDLMGYTYQPRYDDHEKMLAALEKIPAGIIVVDRAGSLTRHGQMLMEGLRRHPEKWVQTPPAPGSDRGGDIRVFRYVGRTEVSSR